MSLLQLGWLNRSLFDYLEVYSLRTTDLSNGEADIMSCEVKFFRCKLLG